MFGKKKSIRIHIEGMTCGHCVARVTKALESVDGVNRAKVKMSAGEAVVSLEKDVNPSILLNAIKEAGYNASM